MFEFNGRSSRTGLVERSVAGGNSAGDWTLAGAELAEVLAAQPYEHRDRAAWVLQWEGERWVSTRLGATAIELPGTPRMERRKNGRACSLSVINSVPDQCTVRYWVLTSVGLMGGAFEALSALLRAAPFSKSAISRIVGRLQRVFTEWRKPYLKGAPV